MRTLLIVLIFAFVGCGDAPLLVQPESVAMLGEQDAKGPPPCKGHRKNDPGCEDPAPEPPPEEPPEEDPPEEPPPPEDPPDEPPPPDDPPDEPPDDPTFDVAISPGQSIQSAVNANPTGTVFLIRAGTHTGQQVTPKADQVFRGEAGAILDGQGAAHAFVGTAGNVTVEGLEIHGYIPPTKDQGAVQCNGCTGWQVLGNEIHGIQGSGVRLASGSAGVRVAGNALYGNDNLGVSAFQTTGALIENNTIEGNGFSPRTGPGEAAGMKFVGAVNPTVRGNFVRDNSGRGIWLDTDIFGALVEGNTVEDNALEGIWLEVVCDGGIVRGNTVRRNGLNGPLQWWPDKAGIQVLNGVNILVENNTLEGNLNGIAVLGAVGYPTHACTPAHRNITVRNNQVVQSGNGSAAAGAVDNMGTVDYSGIRFEGNTYTLGAGVAFRWRNQTLSLAQWQAAGNQ